MDAGPAGGGGVAEFMGMGYMPWESVHSLLICIQVP